MEQMAAESPSSKIKPYDAWVLGALISGQSLNGELDTMSSQLKRMAQYLGGLKKQSRQSAWLAMMAARDDSENLIQAVADQDPSKPPPPVDEPLGIEHGKLTHSGAI